MRVLVLPLIFASLAVAADKPAVTSYKLHHVLDDGLRDRGTGKPLEAFSMLIPDGWKFAGGVKWVINEKGPMGVDRMDLVMPATVSFVVSSADGKAALQCYPETRFADLRGSPTAPMFPPGSNYAGAIVWPVVDPETYITQYVIPRQRQLAAQLKVVKQENCKELADLFTAESAVIAKAMGQAGVGNIAYRASAVTVDYQQDGVAYRENFVCCLMYLSVQGCTMFWPRFNMSSRAPRESFDSYQPAMLTCVTSIRPGTRWLVEYIRMTDRAAAAIADVDRVCAQIDKEIWEHRARSQQYIQRQMQDTILGMQSYKGPDGQGYYLPNDKDYQIDPQGNIRSGQDLPDEPGWTKLAPRKGK